MTVGSLFSGIGGLDLGFERAGFRVLWQCEADPWCRKVLAKHWPDIPCFEDVRTLARRTWDNADEDDEGFVECRIHEGEDFGDCACIGADQLADEAGIPDVIIGGFPCQPVSVLGKRRGADDARWLWPEFHRIVRELGPAWVVAENVAGLVSKGLDEVLADLEGSGYTCRPFSLEAGVIGAEHRRERAFVVAYAQGVRVQGLRPEGVSLPQPLAGPFLPVRRSDGQWEVEPDLCRVPDGVSARVDRLRALGNAVVPQVAEHIARYVLALHEEAA